MFPDYYCRRTSPQAFDLAAAAMISSFKPEGYAWAVDNMEVDGESDYTITAEILNPPDDETETDDPDYQDIAEKNGFVVVETDNGFLWRAIDESESQVPPHTPQTEEECWKACCEENDLISDSDNDDSEMWCNVNGAWMLVEVFPCDDDFDPREYATAYESLAACFDAEVLKLAAE